MNSNQVRLNLPLGVSAVALTASASASAGITGATFGASGGKKGAITTSAGFTKPQP